MCWLVRCIKRYVFATFGGPQLPIDHLVRAPRRAATFHRPHSSELAFEFCIYQLLPTPKSARMRKIDGSFIGLLTQILPPAIIG